MPIPKLIITAALMAAQVAMGAMRKIEGPRLDSLEVTTAEYGTPLEDFWGIRRLEGRPVIWAEKLREKKKKSKTKGGKYAEYKYFGTWAVAIAGHEIDAVTKIWMDKHPVYQATKAGPLMAAIVSAVFRDQGDDEPVAIPLNSVAIYLGTDTQNPDPRMEAWFEDADGFGPGTCSANRGTAYIVFKDIPLEKFGNRIPQVDVEAVSSKTPAYIPETLDSGFTTAQAYFSPSRTWLLFGGASFSEVWDVPTRTLVAQVPVGGGSVMNDDGTFYAVDTDVRLVTLGGGETVIADTASVGNGPLFRAGGQLWLDGFEFARHVTGNPLDPVTLIALGADVHADHYFTDANDSSIVWVSGEGAVDNSFSVSRIDSGLVTDTFDITGTPGDGAAYGMDNGAGQLLIDQGGYRYLIDKTDGSVVAGPDNSAGTYASDRCLFEGVDPGDTTMWIGTTEISTLDLSILRTLDPSLWDLSALSFPIYDKINHAVWATAIGTAPIIRYLDRVSSGDVTLGDIVTQDSLRANLAVNATALDQIVKGYSVVQGPVKDRISPLLDLFDSILRLHDFTVEGIKRGTSSQGIIDVSDFVREGDDARYEIEETQDTDLPQRVEFKFADTTKSQQVNNVIAMRQTVSTDSVRVQPIDGSTYADTPDGAQQKIDRFIRDQWNRRAVVKNSVTAQLLAAEIGDVYDLDLDGTLWTVELERQTLSATKPMFACEWRRTYPSLLGSSSGPTLVARDDEDIFIPGPAKTFVLDIPLIRDVDNALNPVFYFALGGFGAGVFPGASLYESTDEDGDYDDIAAVSSSEEATWGFTTDALGDANPNLWDRGNSVNVKVYGDTLETGLTEADIYANPLRNLIALRNPATGLVELLNFTTAVLEMDGTYTLSGLLRGRRGTEGAVGVHESGDEFVLVSDLHHGSLGLSDVGDDLFFKGQTFGRDPDFAAAIEVDFTGASLKPYAPVVWHVTKDSASGDITIELSSRTRIGGAWNGSTIPTGEITEAYEFDVYDGDTFKRTLDGVTKFLTYSAADQTTDFGAEIEAEDLEGFAYQLSASVGRGFARAA